MSSMLPFIVFIPFFFAYTYARSIVLAKQTRTNECTFRTLSGNIFSENVPIMRAVRVKVQKIARHLTNAQWFGGSVEG